MGLLALHHCTDTPRKLCFLMGPASMTLLPPVYSLIADKTYSKNSKPYSKEELKIHAVKSSLSSLRQMEIRTVRWFCLSLRSKSCGTQGDVLRPAPEQLTGVLAAGL